MSNWAKWVVILGVAMDIADAMTTKDGASGGVLYGATSPLNKIASQLPGKLTPGQVVAAIGAGGLLLK